MKLRIIFLLLFVSIFLGVLSVTAGSGKGRTTFVSKCGQCHKEEGGEAAPFSPTKYASRQWERFFSRNQHQRKRDISDKVTEDELEIIKNYLINHAADSSQPEAAGLK